ncbi:peptidase S9 [Bifidobacterium margollesii]|uniref:Peptidase S9 n=1 Tax=Bifidobacterium margollesii TaxID=2020964 RepID=A0A2N5J8C7_9BIFI|nr:acyl-CoA thioester hydrolase/BAAT C-terminal domain-containing protein [Bifidobacterium margollesii]PLS30460.1 peptidase S9 [Bifidobacterium margollesii]
MNIALATLALLVVFALIGKAMAPAWKVEPFSDHISLGSPDVGVAAKDVTVHHEGTYRIRESTLHLTMSDGTVLEAVLRQPVGASPRHAACLFVHGSGTGSSRDFGDIASSMASAGITTLVPAKRLDDYSWTHRDYERFADDYRHCLDWLRNRPDVNPAKTGLYAESEGTWISTLITDRDHDIAFAVLSSAPVVSGRQLMAMAASAYLQEAGVPASVRQNTAKLMSMDFAPFDLRYGDFDAKRYLSSLTMPVLVNYGVMDTAMPIEQGARTILDVAHRAGNDNVTVRYFHANHQMREGAGLFEPGLPLADGYTKVLDDWVNAVAAGTKADGWATAQVAGATPDQRFTAPHWTSSGLIGSLGLLCAMTVAAILLPISAAVVAAALAVVRRFDPSRGRFPVGIARLLTAAGVMPATIILLLSGYLAYAGWSAVMLNRRSLFFAIGWMVLRLGALCNMVFAAWLLVRCRRDLRERMHRTSSHDRGSGRSGDSVAAISGWGQWLVVGLIMAGALLSLTLMAFWGLFDL